MYIFCHSRIFIPHECVNLVVLLLFSHLPLPLPLPIFSAQLAYYRQRKTKTNVTQPQKKTAKRKGSSVHTHDVPKEEYPLAAQDVGKGIESRAEDSVLLESRAEDSNLLETVSETEVNLTISWISLHSICG